MDRIADMLITIKNAGIAGHETVTVPYSKLKHSIAAVLEKEGFVKGVAKKTKKNHPVLEIGIEYKNSKPRIHDLVRVSKPSRRLYYGVKDIRPVKNGHGLLVLSTPKGILTDKEAKKELVGGEALFKIW